MYVKNNVFISQTNYFTPRLLLSLDNSIDSMKDDRVAGLKRDIFYLRFVIPDARVCGVPLSAGVVALISPASTHPPHKDDSVPSFPQR